MFGTDVLDNVETLNIPKFIPSNDGEPFHPYLSDTKPEVEAFSRVSRPLHLHMAADMAKKSLDVASKVFKLFALILELPEDYFSSRHEYDDASEDHLRYMRYLPRSIEDDAKVRNVWSRAHTDFGSLTLRESFSAAPSLMLSLVTGRRGAADQN